MPRYVIIGIVLGLGMGFMLDGIRMMSGGWIIAGIGLVEPCCCYQQGFPAMFLLLIFGAVCGIALESGGDGLSTIRPHLRLPSLCAERRDLA